MIDIFINFSVHLYNPFNRLFSKPIKGKVKQAYTACLLLCFLFAGHSSKGVDEQDSLALVALHNSTGGNSWFNKWDLNTPVNTWYGVSISNDRVVNLDLYKNRLTGELPPEIGQLVNLETLILSDNYLEGEIPPEIGNLVNLTVFEAFTSQAFPPPGNNQLSGPIPPEIQNLTKLVTFSVSSNNLSGEIPPGIGQLSNLSTLDLSFNNLSGEIPAEIWQLSGLTILNLSANKLYGEVSPQIGLLTSLSFLSLSHNELSGEIPTEVGLLTSLSLLSLSRNQLSGEIPTEVGLLTGLNILDLGRNNLSGGIPDEIGQLTNLTNLFLSENELTGNIPPEIGNLTSLSNLNLSENNLDGPIPVEIGLLTNLFNLYLSENNLSGSIPPEIGNLVNSFRFHLNNNRLSGSIPAEIGNLSNVTFFHLNDNQLTGAIPPEIGGMTKVRDFYLNNNNLSGSIPAEIGSLTNLDYIDFSHNQLSGAIPKEIGNLFGLYGLNLAFNQLSDIPSEIGNLFLIDKLNLSHNQLISIPGTIGEMPYLSDLNLSNNLLTTLPEGLGESEVLSLDLSENRFEQLPPVLSQLSKLRSLFLYNNNLAGSVSAEMFADMPNLKELLLYGNLLEDLGDLSEIQNLEVLLVMDNQLTFEDLEPNMKGSFDFLYAPQRNEVISDTFKILPGDSIMIGREVGGISNLYSWTQNGQKLDEDKAFITIDSMAYENAGTYVLEITNKTVPDLVFSYRASLLIEPDTPVVNHPLPYCIGTGSVTLTSEDGGGASTLWFSDASFSNLIGEGKIIEVSVDSVDRDTIYVVNQAEPLQKSTAILLIKRPTLIKEGNVLSVAEPPGASYEWYHQGILIAGANESKYVMQPGEENGPYTVRVITAEGCAATSQKFYPNGKPTATNEASLGAASVILYPNPHNGIFAIQIENQYTGAMTVRVYDLMGEILWEQETVKSQKAFKQNIDLRILSQGLYVLEIMSKNESFRTRFIKK